MKRAAEWMNSLDERVYERLCDCTSTKKDMVPLTVAYHIGEGLRGGLAIRDSLDYMLEWVLDWNGGMWDYTEEEYNEWLVQIFSRVYCNS